jgi:hypothetical protein
VSASQDYRFLIRRLENDAVGEAAEERVSHLVVNLRVLARSAFDRCNRYIERTEELSAQARMTRFVPIGGLEDVFKSSRPDDEPQIHAP